MVMCDTSIIHELKAVSSLLGKKGKIIAVSRENRYLGFATRSDTNHAVQLQKMARSWKFWIEVVDGLYYL